MKVFRIFGLIMMFLALASVESAPAPTPGKFKAIKKGAQIIGKSLHAISIADTVHDIYTNLRGRH